MTNRKSYDAIVMGLSAGGLDALETVFPRLPDIFSIPIMIVQHRGKGQDNNICRYLTSFCNIGKFLAGLIKSKNQ